jgi:hypothetical protein
MVTFVIQPLNLKHSYSNNNVPISLNMSYNMLSISRKANLHCRSYRPCEYTNVSAKKIIPRRLSSPTKAGK